MTDSQNASASCTGTVHVEGASEQIGDTIGLVQSFNFKSGTATSLIVKLQDANNLVSSNNIAGACSKLQDFINLVNAQKGKKQISATQADQLIAEATGIRAGLNCP